jgi:hypothetical protein
VKAVSVTLLALLACNGGPSPAPPPSTGPDLGPGDHPKAAVLETMRVDEGTRLDAHDFANTPPWAEASGANPFLVHRIGADRFVGALRGTGEIVVLDAAGKRVGAALDRVPGITGWAWSDDEAFFAVGERAADVHAFAIEGGTPKRRSSWRVPDVHALRDIAIGPGGELHLADMHRSRVITIAAPQEGKPLVVASTHACGGAVQVQRVGDSLLANCLLEHRVRVWGPGAEASIEHDGPIFAFDARAVEGGLEIAIAGVEDHPLDRKGGSFGFVDSFAFVYAVRGSSVERIAEINVGEHMVVTPKWIRWQDDGTLATAGYGSAGGAVIDPVASRVQPVALPPGITSVAGSLQSGLAADPLLDAWIVLGEHWSAHAIEDARPTAVRVGEALVFTTLMAPAGSSTGKLSRFTCETCHFEGNVDGRTHHTGRFDVHATTKTIRGLFGNRPHFTRALDRTTTAMIDNEFNVASKGTPGDPWFTLSAADHPWLATLGVQGSWSPEQLRRALFEFLTTFTPDRNPAVLGRTELDATEQRGAELFAAHCESCHGARLRSDDPSSRVEPAQWAAHVLGNGAILWASDERTKTGVEPYVHDDGARVPSLRRLWVNAHTSPTAARPISPP